MFKHFLDTVKSGMEGKAVWIPIGLPRLGKHVGISKNIYSIVAGYAGCGKTSFTDTCYLLNPYDYITNNESSELDINWVYFSMERSTVHKIAKWVCQKLYVDHNILIDVPTILSWTEGKSKVDKYLYKLIHSYYEYFEKLRDKLFIYDGAKEPEEIKKIAELHLLSLGVVVTGINGRIIINQDLITTFEDDVYEENSDTGEKRLYKDIMIFGKEYRIYEDDEKYIPKNPKQVCSIIIDHIGCALGKDKKPTIDKLSANNRYLRDFYGASPIAVSQMNRSMSDSVRRTKMELLPEAGDIKDSSNPGEDADVIIGLMNPYKFKIQEIVGYNVQKFKNKEGENRLRTATVIKNTFGADDITVGLQFVGECGFFKEILKPEELRETDYNLLANPPVTKNYKIITKDEYNSKKLDNFEIDFV